MTPPTFRGPRSHAGRIPDDEEQLSFDLETLPQIVTPVVGPPQVTTPSLPAEVSVEPGAIDPVATDPVAVEPTVSRQPGRLRAVEVATLLGRPLPTPEQVAVIEAPVAPLLVVAGAGSGKTETMAARVVHLVAGGDAAPDQILGLTFTRKAAAELSDRIRLRLSALARRGIGPADEARSQPVTVSTYHAYAAALLSDHGLRLGLDGTTRLVGEAGAWQIVDELVERWDGPMSAVDSARATVVDAVLALAGECAEHLVGVEAVDAVLADIVEHVVELPAKLGDGAPGRPGAEVRKVLERLNARRQVLPLVTAYLHRKRELGVLDFGDQVALAARLALEVPEVAATERARYRVVLLDEYQDTSHAQLALLRALFGGGHPVTAVGDPHQSIYGWRGASAGNLQRFPQDFPELDDATDAAPRPAAVAQLATSWRNDHAVLSVANHLAAPLRHGAPWAPHAPSVEVPQLRARDGAEVGEVAVRWVATLEDEAATVAEFAETAWRAGRSAAVLCRARSQFPIVEAALRVRGLPVEVVGLGGLLHVPEVADLRATLEVVHDASRGDALMRLLTGVAWRLGPADLDALGAWARALHRRLLHPAGGTAPVVAEASEELSLAAALDDLPPPDWHGPAGEHLSASGRERLARLSGVLRHLRGRTGLPLPDLVLETERALLLDIEVAAHPGRRPAAARANLDAFVEVAAAFTDTGDRPGLGAFLAWLSAAETEERGLEAPLGEVSPDAIQVLTVHAAKGLEWDAVAVPGLVEGTFPSGHAGRSPGRSTGWLTALGAVPFGLRGDVDSLPHWRHTSANSQQELTRELDTFTTDCGAYEVAEERRLAYVAVTRARRTLLLTGAVWGDGARPRTPSRFLVEVAEQAQAGTAGVAMADWADPIEDGETNPRDHLTRAVGWPLDPLGERRDAVETAAALVREAMLGGFGGGGTGEADEIGTGAAEDSAEDSADEWADEWADEVEALLAERDAGRSGRREVALPRHLSASSLVALAEDPQRLADRLRRPMPQPPSPATRRGSSFHTWLEQRFAAAALVDVDELPGAADDEIGSAPEQVALDDLQRAFLASPWADLTPSAVEVAVETPVAGVMVRGRIDAVFRLDEGERPGTDRADTGGGRWDVVDWKTGSPPTDPEQARARAVQLAVYRLAWSTLAEVPLDDVGAAFFYAATGETVRPVDLMDEQGLADLITAAITPTP